MSAVSRRAFLAGAAASALTPMLPNVTAGLMPAAGEVTVTYEIFAAEMLRKIAEVCTIPYELIEWQPPFGEHDRFMAKWKTLLEAAQNSSIEPESDDPSID